MRRAFVIQLDSQACDEWCTGRIEHVDSGQSQHFHSLSEAVSFARRVLAQIELDDPNWNAPGFNNAVRINDK